MIEHDLRDRRRKPATTATIAGEALDSDVVQVAVSGRDESIERALRRVRSGIEEFRCRKGGEEHRHRATEDEHVGIERSGSADPGLCGSTGDQE